MVASLLRLRLLSFGNRIARPRSIAEASAIAVAAVLVLVGVVGIIALDRIVDATTPELRSAAFVVVGSVVVAGFWFLPFAFRVDDGMAPRAFSAFELPPARLAAALLLTRLISVPAVLLIGLLIVQAGAWRDAGGDAILVAVLAGLLLLGLCLVGSQVASAVAGHEISWRNVSGLLAVVAVALAAPFALALATLDWSASGVTYLRRVAAVLEWTPFGVAWAAPGAAAAGEVGVAWLRLAVAFAVLLLLVVAWYAIVRRAGRTVPPAPQERSHAGLGVFGALPPTAGGVVAARSIVYWMRDPRYVVPVLILPLVPVVIAVAFSLAGIPDGVIAWLCVPLVTLLIGWSVHNDVASDGTAFWLHVVTGVDGRADRWGRIVPPLLVGAAVAVGGSFLTVWLIGDSSILLSLVALSTCTLLVALGVGSVASAVAPYPTVAPGDGPFAQPQALRGGEPVKQAVSLLIVLALCAPTIVFVLVALLADPAAMPAAIWLGFGSGLVVLIAGVELGALAVSRRAPEILAFTQQN